MRWLPQKANDMIVKASTLDLHDLTHASCFPHAVENIEIIETHISWVVLTGEFAYKIKKPVEFDFVDYSTPEKRKHFCELEVALNRRFASEIYVDVVPISMVYGDLKFDNRTNVVDYAVKMRQFDQNQIIANRIKSGAFTTAEIEDFGRYLAELHTKPTSGKHDSIEQDVDFGSATCNESNAMEIASFLAAEWKGTELERSIDSLRDWIWKESGRLWATFETRKRDGFVRKCHGDMHLKNLLHHHNRIVAFDGIEFNDEFQFIDTANDLAFPVMDFAARGRSFYAKILLNAYMEETNDFEALKLLPFYFVYRALVRAKITWMNPKNHLCENRLREAPWRKYITAARNMLVRGKPFLAIMHGFSGSGKSTRAMELVKTHGAIRIRSDVVRNTIDSTTGDRYSKASRDVVYQKMVLAADKVLAAGWPVVIDATFLSRSDRDVFAELARRRKVRFGIVHCEAPMTEMTQRILFRRNDPSEANLDVLQHQLHHHDPLQGDEPMLWV